MDAPDSIDTKINFSILDWAFSILTGLYFPSIWITFLKSTPFERLFQDLKIETTPMTKMVLSGWFLPLVFMISFGFYVYALFPKSPLKNNLRRYLILAIFFWNLGGFLIYCYGITIPFKKMQELYGITQSNQPCIPENPKDYKKMTLKMKLKCTSKTKALCSKTGEKSDLTSTALSEARLIPNILCNKTDGFKILNLKKGGVLEELGFKSGDIVLNIDGKPLTSVEKLMPILQAGLNENSEWEILRKQ